MPRFVSKVNISHGQGRDKDKKTWNIKGGQVFDPGEMQMSEATVQNLVDSKRIKAHDGGEASMARPVSTPVTSPAPEGSTQGGRTAPTGGSTQGGKAPGA